MTNYCYACGTCEDLTIEYCKGKPFAKWLCRDCKDNGHLQDVVQAVLRDLNFEKQDYSHLFAIVNDADRPYPRLVAQVIDGHFYYMQREYEQRLKGFDRMPVDSFRPSWLIEDFGFVVFPCPDYPGRMEFIKVHPSKATYPDGTRREWQGQNRFILPLVHLE